MSGNFEYKNDEERITAWLERSRRDGECIIWEGWQTRSGANAVGGSQPYPKARYKGKTVRVNRFICKYFYPDMLDTEHAHHTCENSLCINPLHIVPRDKNEHSRHHIRQLQAQGKMLGNCKSSLRLLRSRGTI